MWNFISRFLDRIFCVIGAVLFSQFPQFFLQYTQRLAGHLDELRLQIAQLSKMAALSGKSLDLYIHKFVSHSDAEISRQGEWMQRMVERHHSLGEALYSIQHATPFQRPWAFISHLQRDIAQATLESFEPGVSLTLETVIYAFLGLLLGYASYFFISRFISHFAALFIRRPAT